MVSFLEKLIEVNCGENHCPLIQVGESYWILLLREYFFSAWSSDWRGVGDSGHCAVTNTKAGGCPQASSFFLPIRKTMRGICGHGQDFPGPWGNGQPHPLTLRLSRLLSSLKKQSGASHCR